MARTPAPATRLKSSSEQHLRRRAVRSSLCDRSPQHPCGSQHSSQHGRQFGRTGRSRLPTARGRARGARAPRLTTLAAAPPGRSTGWLRRGTCRRRNQSEVIRAILLKTVPVCTGCFRVIHHDAISPSSHSWQRRVRQQAAAVSLVPRTGAGCQLPDEATAGGPVCAATQSIKTTSVE